MKVGPVVLLSELESYQRQGLSLDQVILAVREYHAEAVQHDRTSEHFGEVRVLTIVWNTPHNQKVKEFIDQEKAERAKQREEESAAPLPG